LYQLAIRLTDKYEEETQGKKRERTLFKRERTLFDEIEEFVWQELNKI